MILTLHDLMVIVVISIAVGFGMRLGHEMYPTVDRAVAHALALPVWLVILIARRIRRRKIKP